MAKRPGQIFELSDKRKCIIYNDQPLFNHGRVIFTLLNDDLSLMMDEKGKQKVLIKSKQEYVRMFESKEMIRIGFVD